MDEFGSDAIGPDALRKDLVKSFTAFEKDFRINFPLIWIGTLLAPIVVTCIVLGLLYLTLGPELGPLYIGKILTHAGLTFFVFGRFIILLGMSDEAAEGHNITMEPYELFAMVTYMDFITALFVTFHMGFLFRLPWVGEKIAALVWDGRFLMEKQPWIKKIAFFGLVAFVIFPTSTTGSIGGSIFGRLLGLSRWMTVSGVLLGSILGNGLMYIFSNQLNQWIDPRDVWLKIVGVLIIVGLFVLLEVRYQRVKKQYFGKEMSSSGPGDAESGATSPTDAAQSNELPPTSVDSVTDPDLVDSNQTDSG